MKHATSVLAATIGIAVFGAWIGSAAIAQTASDKKWVNQCVLDNKAAKVAASVVLSYCTCMNDQMSDNETQSISTWEKSHPNERKACERKAGWD